MFFVQDNRFEFSEKFGEKQQQQKATNNNKTILSYTFFVFLVMYLRTFFKQLQKELNLKSQITGHVV